MSGFYASIMFIGIILILISFVWIFFDRKKTLDEEKTLNEKRDELVRIIKDAELMVEELNKFSDYIVSQIDQKSSEAMKIIDNAEERINNLKKENDYNKIDDKQRTDKSLIAGPAIKLTDPENNSFMENNEIFFENLVPGGFENIKSIKFKDLNKSMEKVISFSSKHKEVISLAHKGLNETEIARKLNMGKGEIQLILGVNK
ncbi:MAG: hypothetical protein GX660_26765 [Clostridiaceae bacterium]|nr:hypothetical protein [Clostridiaceae bacterium]